MDLWGFDKNYSRLYQYLQLLRQPFADPVSSNFRTISSCWLNNFSIPQREWKNRMVEDVEEEEEDDNEAKLKGK